jgi:hypothetical protein
MMTKINTLADVHEFVLNKKISSIATNATNADNGVSTVDEKPCKEGRVVDPDKQIRIVKTADISISPTEYSYQYMLHTCDNNGNTEHKMLFKSNIDNLDKDGANDTAYVSYEQQSGTDEVILVADTQLESMIKHFKNSLPPK